MPTESTKKKFGLAFWMERVIEECDRASEAFAPDPVLEGVRRKTTGAFRETWAMRISPSAASAGAYDPIAGPVIGGHAKATRAYAWSSPIEGSDKRRFFAVLHVPPITSPVEAVRAAIVAEHKGDR